jgi:transposase
MNETLRHQQAFDYYYSLGHERSYPQVASEFTVSLTSIKKWAKAFKWQQRIIDRDIENAQKLEEKTNNTIVDARSKYLIVIQATLHQFMKKLKSGNIRINSVKDLETLAKLELLLREGEVPSSNGVVNITIVKDDQDND